MKTGKFIPLGYYENVKIGYGTVDFKNLKTVYLKLNSWLLPESESDDFDLILSKTRREIKTYLYYLETDFFRKENIVDLDVRTKGIKLEKKSFMNLEITLFVKNQFDIKDSNVKKTIKSISENIINCNLKDKNLFNFYKNKK
jgi:hypothetical protein